MIDSIYSSPPKKNTHTKRERKVTKLTWPAAPCQYQSYGRWWPPRPCWGWRDPQGSAVIKDQHDTLSTSLLYRHWQHDCLVGLVLKASASGAEHPGFESCLRRGFFGTSHTTDLKTGTPVATLPGFWHYRVSAGTGQPGVSILWLGEVESLICNFYLSVAARTIVCADPSLRYTSMLLGH